MSETKHCGCRQLLGWIFGPDHVPPCPGIASEEPLYHAVRIAAEMLNRTGHHQEMMQARLLMDMVGSSQPIASEESELGATCDAQDDDSTCDERKGHTCGHYDNGTHHSWAKQPIASEQGERGAKTYPCPRCRRPLAMDPAGDYLVESCDCPGQPPTPGPSREEYWRKRALMYRRYLRQANKGAQRLAGVLTLTMQRYDAARKLAAANGEKWIEASEALARCEAEK